MLFDFLVILSIWFFQVVLTGYLRPGISKNLVVLGHDLSAGGGERPGVTQDAAFLWVERHATFSFPFCKCVQVLL